MAHQGNLAVTDIELRPRERFEVQAIPPFVGHAKYVTRRRYPSPTTPRQTHHARNKQDFLEERLVKHMDYTEDSREFLDNYARVKYQGAFRIWPWLMRYSSFESSYESREEFDQWNSAELGSDFTTFSQYLEALRDQLF